MSILSSRDPRILVVCHGNINRSPLCAAVLRQNGLTQVREAALKYNGGGERASKKMRDAAIELGLNLEKHRSTAVTFEGLAWAELVVFMDGGNHKRLEALSGQGGPLPNQVWCCLGYYAKPHVTRIPDPAFIKRGTPEFDAVVRQIYQASINLAEVVQGGRL